MQTICRWVLVVALVALSVSAQASVVSTPVTVATTATLLASAGVNGMYVAVRNAGTASIYVGPSTVTTATGFELQSGVTLSAHLGNADAIYGIVAASTVTAHVLKIQ